MASEVDIANLALARLGDDASVASIDPPEGSSQAEHCARFYPIARDSMLEHHDWSFSTRRAQLAQLSVPTYNWQYAYARPSLALRILSVMPATASPEEDGVQYELGNTAEGTQIILTNLEEAVARYTVRVTDTSLFPPLFVDALAWLLAAHLAGPVIKGDVGIAEARRCAQMHAVMLTSAIRQDANQKDKPPVHTPDWIATRGAINPILADGKITRS